MKVLLEIEDSKAPYLMEVLKGLSFVKTKPLTAYSVEILENVKQAVEEMKLVKAGEIIARDADELF